MTIYVSANVPVSAVSDISGIVLENVPCDPTVYVGAAVRMDALGTAFNALADNINTSNVIGIVESKDGATLCNIRVSGLTIGVFSTLDVTREYFLSDTVPGDITTTVPTSSGHIKLKLGQPFNDSRFLFMKGERVVRK